MDQGRREVSISQICRPRQRTRAANPVPTTAATAAATSTMTSNELDPDPVAAAGTTGRLLAGGSVCCGPSTGATPPPVGWAWGPAWPPPPLLVGFRVGDGVALGVGRLGHPAPL